MSADPAVDTRLETALSHWSGRMVANGVPFADFEAVRSTITSWSDWCATWADRGAAHEALGDEAEADGHLLSAAEHWTRAAACFHFGKFLFFDDPDLARRTADRGVACRTKALPHLQPPGERIDVPFDATTLPGNLRLPTGVERPPVVIMAMGLDSAKEEMDAHEQDFLRRGLATFAFDGPGQGEVEHRLPIRADYEAPIAAVVDALIADGRIDPGRIGLWGVSLGGYYAPRAAAFERRITACVSLSGPYSFGAVWDEIPDLTRTAFRHRSHSDTDEQARVRATALDLEGVARRITCPLLVISGGRDRMFGIAHAQRLVAESAGPADHLHVPEGNHVVNNLPHRYRPQTADWLASHLA